MLDHWLRGSGNFLPLLLRVPAVESYGLISVSGDAVAHDAADMNQTI